MIGIAPQIHSDSFGQLSVRSRYIFENQWELKLLTATTPNNSVQSTWTLVTPEPVSPAFILKNKPQKLRVTEAQMFKAHMSERATLSSLLAKLRTQYPDQADFLVVFSSTPKSPNLSEPNP
jgi:hypothetical protein